jgi:hypothetical protein
MINNKHEIDNPIPSVKILSFIVSLVMCTPTIKTVKNVMKTDNVPHINDNVISHILPYFSLINLSY